MWWNEQVIKYSNGMVTKDNIEKFNNDFYLELSSNHDSNIKDQTDITKTIVVWGMKINVSYTAAWTGDKAYPEETEPAGIDLLEVNGQEIEW